MLNTCANQNSWWMFLSRGVHINGMKTGEATGACHVSICLGYPAVMPKKLRRSGAWLENSTEKTSEKLRPCHNKGITRGWKTTFL